MSEMYLVLGAWAAIGLVGYNMLCFFVVLKHLERLDRGMGPSVPKRALNPNSILRGLVFSILLGPLTIAFMYFKKPENL
jgi:hypothetical protein